MYCIIFFKAIHLARKLNFQGSLFHSNHSPQAFWRCRAEDPWTAMLTRLLLLLRDSQHKNWQEVHLHHQQAQPAVIVKYSNFVLKNFYFLDGFKHLSTIHIVSPTENCKKLKMSPQNPIPDFRTTIISLLAKHSTQIYQLGSEHCHSLKPLNIVIAKYIHQSQIY